MMRAGDDGRRGAAGGMPTGPLESTLFALKTSLAQSRAHWYRPAPAARIEESTVMETVLSPHRRRALHSAGRKELS